jgi:hypothetical protein
MMKELVHLNTLMAVFYFPPLIVTFPYSLGLGKFMLVGCLVVVNFFYGTSTFGADPQTIACRIAHQLGFCLDSGSLQGRLNLVFLR